MNATSAPSRPRPFDERAQSLVEAQVRAGQSPCCPGCGAALEERDAGPLPLDAVGLGLECAPCRRVHVMVIHTERSLRLVRMRRLAAAVRDAAPQLVQAAA